MPVTDAEMSALSECYGARGYLVVARRIGASEFRVGDIIKTNFRLVVGKEIDQPMRVSAVTTRQDFLDQCAFIKAVLREEPTDDAVYGTFYKVESD